MEDQSANRSCEEDESMDACTDSRLQICDHPVPDTELTDEKPLSDGGENSSIPTDIANTQESLNDSEIIRSPVENEESNAETNNESAEKGEEVQSLAPDSSIPDAMDTDALLCDDERIQTDSLPEAVDVTEEPKTEEDEVIEKLPDEVGPENTADVRLLQEEISRLKEVLAATASKLTDKDRTDVSKESEVIEDKRISTERNDSVSTVSEDNGQLGEAAAVPASVLPEDASNTEVSTRKSSSLPIDVDSTGVTPTESDEGFKLIELESKIFELERSLESSSQRQNDLQKRYDDAVERETCLTEKVTLLTEEKASLVADVQNHINEVDKATKCLEETKILLQSQKEEHQSIAENFQKQITELQHVNTTITSELAAANERIQAFEKTSKQDQERCRSYEAKIQLLEKAIEEIRAEKSRESSKLMASLSEAMADLLQTKKEKLELEEKTAKFGEERKSLGELIERNCTDLCVLKQTNEKQKEELDQAAKAVQTYRSEMEKLHRKHDEAMAGKKQELENLKTGLKAIQAKFEISENNLQLEQNRVSRLKSDLEAKLTAERKLKEEKNILEAKIFDTEKSLAEKMKIAGEREAVFHQAANANLGLLAEIEHLKGANNMLHNANDRLIEEVRGKEHSNNRLLEAERRLQEANERYHSVEVESSSLRENMRICEVENEKLKNELLAVRSSPSMYKRTKTAKGADEMTANDDADEVEVTPMVQSKSSNRSRKGAEQPGINSIQSSNAASSTKGRVGRPRGRKRASSVFEETSDTASPDEAGTVNEHNDQTSPSTATKTAKLSNVASEITISVNSAISDTGRPQRRAAQVANNGIYAVSEFLRNSSTTSFGGRSASLHSSKPEPAERVFTKSEELDPISSESPIPSLEPGLSEGSKPLKKRLRAMLKDPTELIISSAMAEQSVSNADIDELPAAAAVATAAAAGKKPRRKRT